MKKHLGFAFAALALAPLSYVQAEAVNSSNVFGLMPVSSLTKRTIVAVPWCECSTNDNENIAISNIVKTANLTVGDTLNALSTNGVTLNTWTLAADADGVKYWQSQKQVVQSGSSSDTISADQASAARGTAIMLIRQCPFTVEGTTTNAVPFYLYGQVATTAATSAVVAGTATTPVYNLIAAPATNAQYLAGTSKNVTMTGTPEATDRIFIEQPVNSGKGVNNYAKSLKYVDGKWCYWKMTVKDGAPIAEYAWVEYTDAIPAGVGVWYVSYGGSPTFTWSGVPTK